jgi:nuclear transport factor 2 (NTF2) superfamily protein
MPNNVAIITEYDQTVHVISIHEMSMDDCEKYVLSRFTDVDKIQIVEGGTGNIHTVQEKIIKAADSYWRHRKETMKRFERDVIPLRVKWEERHNKILETENRRVFIEQEIYRLQKEKTGLLITESYRKRTESAHRKYMRKCEEPVMMRSLQDYLDTARGVVETEYENINVRIPSKRDNFTL